MLGSLFSVLESYQCHDRSLSPPVACRFPSSPHFPPTRRHLRVFIASDVRGDDFEKRSSSHIPSRNVTLKARGSTSMIPAFYFPLLLSHIFPSTQAAPASVSPTSLSLNTILASNLTTAPLLSDGACVSFSTISLPKPFLPTTDRPPKSQIARLPCPTPQLLASYSHRVLPRSKHPHHPAHRSPGDRHHETKSCPYDPSYAAVSVRVHSGS